MDGTPEAPFLFSYLPQLVFVDRVRARLYPDGQSSNIAYLILTMHIRTTTLDWISVVAFCAF